MLPLSQLLYSTAFACIREATTMTSNEAMTVEARIAELPVELKREIMLYLPFGSVSFVDDGEAYFWKRYCHENPDTRRFSPRCGELDCHNNAGWKNYARLMSPKEFRTAYMWSINGYNTPHCNKWYNIRVVGEGTPYEDTLVYQSPSVDCLGEEVPYEEKVTILKHYYAFQSRKGCRLAMRL